MYLKFEVDDEAASGFKIRLDDRLQDNNYKANHTYVIIRLIIHTYH